MLDHTIEAQQILEELFSEQVLPFKLFACQVDNIGGDEYVVRFHDSRLHSLDMSWHEGECFRDVFRSAILDRIGRMRGDLRSRRTELR